MELLEKLQDIQQRLKAPKSEHNSFAGFDYRSAEKILEAAKPYLKEHKLVLLLSDEIKQVGDRNYVEATVRLQDKDNAISVTASAREEETKKGMDAAQITGSASSYARKYALSGLFAIDDTKDADSQDNRQHKTVTKSDKISDFQKKKLDLLKDMQEAGMSKDGIEVMVHTALNKGTIDTETDLKKVRDLVEAK